MMTKTMRWAALALLGGCGTMGTGPAAVATGALGHSSPSTRAGEDLDDARPADARALADLPEAPWQAAAIPNAEAPRELLSAWSEADNHDWCAPLAPVDLGDATVRPASYAGGWAVEFDVAGLAGVGPGGRPCRRCGRGAFGIAGTAVRVDDEEPMEAEEVGFRDGSRVRLEEPLGDEDDDAGLVGHVANLEIRGQDCVYQVWSLVDDAHLQQIVQRLRFVDPETEPQPLASGL